MSDGQTWVDIDALLAAQPQGQPSVDIDALMATPSGQNASQGTASGGRLDFPINVQDGAPTGVGFLEELGTAISLGGDRGRFALDRLKKMLPDRAVVPIPDNDGNISGIAISEPGQDDVPINQRQFRTFETGTLASSLPAAFKTVLGGIGSAMGASAGAMTSPVTGVAGPVAGGLAGGAAGDAAANAILQGVDEFVFPGEGASPEDRLADMGTDVAIGAIVPGAVAGARGVVGGARRLVGAGSRRDMAERLTREFAEGGEEAAEALARSRELGGALSPGRVTGSTAQLDEEAATRQFAKDIFDDIDLRNMEAARRGALNVAERLGGAESAEAGTKIASATENAQTAMAASRDSAFQKSLTKADLVSNGARTIGHDVMQTEVDTLIREFGRTATVSDDIEKAMRSVTQIRSRMSGPIPKLTAKEMQREMRALGRAVQAAKRRGNDVEAMINQRLLNARRADLDRAIEEGVPGARFLREARDRYAAATREIESMSEPILERAGIDVANARPELVVRKLLTSGTETSNRKIAKVLGKVDPDALRDARAAVVNSVIDGATEGGQFSLAKYARAIERNQSKLSGLFDGDPKSLQMLNKVARFARDAQARGSVGGPGSRTTPLAMAVAALGGFSSKLLDNIPGISALPQFNREQQSRFFAELIRNPAERERLTALATRLRRNPRAANMSRITELVTRLVEDRTLRIGEDGAREFDFAGERAPVPPIEVQDPTVDPAQLSDLRGAMSPNFRDQEQERQLTGIGSRAPSLKDLVR